ncbi:MAG: NAD-dependent epimerase/dehydratase family protein, partial [Bacteroidales bacterium]|nr:NAD-dependent epimerase/dehydratase family protein [Bacteroidales bacterium]
GVSQDHLNNWRFIANQIPFKNLYSVDILQQTPLRDFFKSYRPQTIFNLAAYGAYSKQKEYDKIYQTNFLATVDLIEIAKDFEFECFIQAGSSSEYGLNSAAPTETEELIPNSHYAVSKAAVFQAIKYFGQIEDLPVAHLRLYSAYGPWEEPDRLIPVLISYARKGKLPPLVAAEISRDFIFIEDVVDAFLKAAANIEKIKGLALNIGTGQKTTIRDLIQTTQDIFQIKTDAEFGQMPNRRWDLKDWYSNPSMGEKWIDFKAKTNLKEGLLQTRDWQIRVNFDNAYWNRTQ